MSSPPPDLRPLTLGELVDRSASFWRAHVWPLFGLYVVFALLSFAMSQALTDAVKAVPQPGRASSDGEAALRALGSGTAWLFAVLGAATWLNWVSSAMVARYVVPLQLGEHATPGDGARRGLARLGALTAGFLLSLAWVVPVLLVCVAPGVALGFAGVRVLSEASSGGLRVLAGVLLFGGVAVGGLGFLTALLWYFLRFALTPHVLALEDAGVLQAFRRSGRLVSGRVAPGLLGRMKIRLSLVLTASTAILLAVNMLTSLPASALQLAYGGNPLRPSDDVPRALEIAAHLVQVVGQGVVAPLALVLTALFYLDVRVRREGLDLERRLAARGGA